MKSMVWLLLAPLAFAVHAEESDAPTPCDNVETAQQNYACAAYSRTVAERELNAAFGDLLERIKEQYAGQGAKITELSNRLNAAQNLWKQVCDADCKVETFDSTPGKEYDAALNTCLAQRSDDRSEYLQSLGLQNSD